MHKPRKRFGQHFLQDSVVIDQFIHLLHLAADDHIVEIGPGLGAITRKLAECCERLDVIEIDRDVIETLETLLEKSPHSHIHCADALTFNLSTLVEKGKKLRVVGNLPYNISSPLLFHFFTFLDCIYDMHFMLQKEVVDRLCAEVGSEDYGRLTVMVQYHCKATSLFLIKPDAFWPPPKVDSAYVRLVPHESYPLQSKSLFAEIVRLAFNQRRKTIRNSLKPLFDVATIESLGLDPNARAQELSVESFAKLANNLYNKKSK
jgi:16S rRNA (adenine1518-N6/adenine1519-N6)-dimethyltransferase